MRIARQRLGLPGSDGRKAPEEIKGADFTLRADLVIKALGFDPEDLPSMFRAPDLAVLRWGTLRTEPSTLMTNLDGVFAGGDVVRGASLVVGRSATDATPRRRSIPICRPGWRH